MLANYFSRILNDAAKLATEISKILVIMDSERESLEEISKKAYPEEGA